LQSTNNLNENIIDFFHILDNVSFVSGAAKTENDIYEITQYSTCYDLKEGTVYYKTYYNNDINAVKLDKRNVVGNELLHYSLIKTPHFYIQN
jgi:choloylglycine hydrolase